MVSSLFSVCHPTCWTLCEASLTPVQVAGPFDRVGVGVIQYVKSNTGNGYAVIFIDFLTKWPEVYPVADQTTLTIAKLLVEKFIPRHGVPRELLSEGLPFYQS